MDRTGLWLAIVGVGLVVGSAVVYTLQLAQTAIPTPESTGRLGLLGEGYLVALFVGTFLALLGVRLTFRGRVEAIRVEGKSPLSPGWLIPYLLSLRRYRNCFVASAVVYGAFYSVITSMVVYQPGVDFTRAYGAVIPSATVTPVSAAPFFTPVMTAYLTDHLGLLVKPLTFLLAVVISILVGLNFVLAMFALDSRVKGTRRGWVGGVGAVVGLFTGCPTCAGLFFANVLGGSGAIAVAAGLAYYQPVFLLISLPVLLATPYLTSRSLGRVFKEGCVVLPPIAGASSPKG